MSVHINDEDVGSLAEFGEEETLVPLLSKRDTIGAVLQCVTFLSRDRGRILLESFEMFTAYNRPFDWDSYHATRKVLFYGDAAEDRAVVEAWLRSLPITEEAEVYVVWKTSEWTRAGAPALVTLWRDFAATVWWSVWNVFNILCILDDSKEWAVICGPERCAVFVEKGAVAPGLPKSDLAYGLDLIRVR